MKLLKIVFANGQELDVDVAEFEPGGIGAIIDHLTTKHGKVVEVRPHRLDAVGVGPDPRD